MALWTTESRFPFWKEGSHSHSAASNKSALHGSESKIESK
jgi:hypothetical protein